MWGGAHLREVELKLRKSGVESRKGGENFFLLARGGTPLALRGMHVHPVHPPAYTLEDSHRFMCTHVNDMFIQ